MPLPIFLVLAVLIGVAFGLNSRTGRRIQVVPMLASVIASWIALQVILCIDWSLRSTFRLSVIGSLILLYLPSHVPAALLAAVGSALVQSTNRRTGEGMMSMLKGFAIILASAPGFGVAGALLGVAIGSLAPGYYRTVFRAADDQSCEPVEVGFGLGLTQGLIIGLLAGAIVLLAVSWYRSRPDALPEAPAET